MELALYISIAFVAIGGFATIYFFNKWQKTELKLAEQIRIAAENATREQLAIQSIDSIRKQMEDWDKTKKEHLEAAKSSMLEVTTHLSNKLLEDHKRERESANKDAEEKVRKTTEDLQNKFQTVFEKMKSLGDKVDESTKTSDLIRNSLLSPQGAGKLTEITLENILNNSGLVKGIDYNLQYTVNNAEGDRLRPDGVIYLPQESALVIDCKSSKFFIDEDKVENEQNLKQTLNTHLNALIAKDYRKAVEQDPKINKVLYTLMFLPSELAVDKIRRIDPGFFDKAQKNSILPVGYAGLINILSHARFYIEKEKQEQNYLVIIDEVKALIDATIKVYSDIGGIGKSLSDGLSKYNKLTDNLNKKIFGKIKKVNSLGLNTASSNELKSLPKYDFVKTDEAQELPDLKLVNKD